jgi:acetyl-CoA acetyltransferase
MEAVCDAARAIAAGEADVCLAGGSESMTRAPFVLGRSADPFPRVLDLADTRLGWRLVSPRMQEMYPPVSLGETAENVAERYQVSRERQDEFALRSHQRAARAQDDGRFDGEIVPVATVAGELRRDEGVRPGLTMDELGAKRPAFRPGGTVTAGNSSPLNDGAACLLLASERALTRSEAIAGRGTFARRSSTSTWSNAANARKAVRLTSQVPMIVAAHSRIRAGQEPVVADQTLGHAANLLWMLTGKKPKRSPMRESLSAVVLAAVRSPAFARTPGNGSRPKRRV